MSQRTFSILALYELLSAGGCLLAPWGNAPEMGWKQRGSWRRRDHPVLGRAMVRTRSTSLTSPSLSIARTESAAAHLPGDGAECSRQEASTHSSGAMTGQKRGGAQRRRDKPKATRGWTVPRDFSCRAPNL